MIPYHLWSTPLHLSFSWAYFVVVIIARKILVADDFYLLTVVLLVPANPIGCG